VAKVQAKIEMKRMVVGSWDADCWKAVGRKIEDCFDGCGGHVEMDLGGALRIIPEVLLQGEYPVVPWLTVLED
jgi:hypothetical protein